MTENNENLQLTANSQTYQLNGTNTTISNLSFKRIGNDDNKDTIKQRIVEQGNKSITPIRDYYRGLEMLKIVDGMKTIEKVAEDIKEILNN